MSSKINHNLYRVPSVAVPTVIMVCFILVAWTTGLIGSITGFLSLPIALLLNTIAAYAAFTGFHDASHFALGKKKWISVVGGELLGLVLLANFQIFRQIHQQHHRHTNDPDHDPDGWLGRGPIWSLPFRWMLVDFHYLRAYRPFKSKLRPFEKVAMCVGVASTLSLIVGLIGSGHFAIFLIVWFLPARFSQFCAAYYADFVPHQRPHAVPRSQDAMAHTANIGGRSLGFFLVGHNMHLIHHLYPGVPFYRCFKIWRERKVELILKGAKVVSLTGSHRAQD
ncbi:MAG: fatty acid desaturase family protein [Rubripirellula sp.]